MKVPDVAGRFIAAIEAADESALRDCLSPDLVVWHNNGDVEHHVEQVVRLLMWVCGKVTGMRYENVRCRPTADGYVQQHVLRATLPNGSPLEVHACLVVTVDGDVITHIDEYVDGMAVEPLFAR